MKFKNWWRHERTWFCLQNKHGDLQPVNHKFFRVSKGLGDGWSLFEKVYIIESQIIVQKIPHV